jgi:hypothetical protein
MLYLTFIIFKCFESGMTPVSIVGILVNEIDAFEIKGISGAVNNLKRIFPDKDSSSAFTSKGAFNAVLKRIDKPGGVILVLRLADKDATGLA